MSVIWNPFDFASSVEDTFDTDGTQLRDNTYCITDHMYIDSDDVVFRYVD